MKLVNVFKCKCDNFLESCPHVMSTFLALQSVLQNLPVHKNIDNDAKQYQSKMKPTVFFMYNCMIKVFPVKIFFEISLYLHRFPFFL